MNRILKVALTLTILFSLAALCAAAEDTAEDTNKTGKHEIEPEEYVVYSALINATYAKYIPGYPRPQQHIKMIVINEHTSQRVSDMEEIGKEAGNDILADYKAKNSQSYQLQNLFKLDVNCVLICKEELKEIFIYEGPGRPQECQKKPDKEFGERPNPDNCMEAEWEKFYDKFPNSQGIMSLSRVGFNQDGTEALVYVEDWCGWLCGEGNYVLLSKENGQWVIRKKMGVFVS